VIKRKEYIGRVLSDRMEKTVVVSIDRTVIHPRYNKYIKRTNKLMAHDETNRCCLGDKVRIMETRPLSANKHFFVVEVLSS